MPHIDLKHALASDDKKICDLFMDQVGLGTLTAADEFGFFDSFDKHNEDEIDASELAKALNSDPGIIDCVCRVLTSMGLLLKTQSKYRLSDEIKSYFLKNSPTYKGSQFYGNRDHWAHQKVLGALKEGWSPIRQNDKSFSEMWEKGDISQEAADRFTGMMHTNISGPATAIARSGIFDAFSHIVDVGGGSGVFLAALAQNYPEKELTLMDLPQVCNSAKGILEKYVETSKIQFHGANFFETHWPADPEALFFSNILHDWTYDKVIAILKNAFSSMKTGSIFICECLLDKEKTSPKHTVIFDLMMYMNHKSNQFTETELSGALMEVGFRNPKVVFAHGYYSVMKADKSV